MPVNLHVWSIFYDTLAEEKQITLLSVGKVSFRADPTHLQRSLANLLSNALRHTSPGGQIVISAEKQDKRVILSVTDDGEGIAPTHLLRIFDRFYRVDNARSQAENTRLGLALVKTIAEMHDGKLLVRSKLGKGSCYSLVLPRQDDI